MNREVVTVAAVFAAGAVAVALTAVAAGRIEPLLPEEGSNRCFAGSYSGSTALTFGFHSEKRTEAAHVTRFVLRLGREPGQARRNGSMTRYHFDWRYDFRLIAETSDKGKFHSAGQCDWTEDAIAHVVQALYCFIDCDGGGITLERSPARSAIDMLWDADGWLRMSTCGGGGEILRGGTKTQIFRLDAAPGEVCKDMPLASY